MAYKGPAESLLPPTLFMSCYSPQVLSAPAALGSLHFFSAGYICFRAFALLFALSRKLLIRYFLGPLPHFLHTFDQCHHLSKAMSCIFPFLSDLSVVFFYHMTYFFICLFSVGLQVKYIILKRRDGVLFNFTVTTLVLRCKLYLLSKCSSWCPSLKKKKNCKQFKYLSIRDSHFQKMGYYLYLYLRSGRRYETEYYSTV